MTPAERKQAAKNRLLQRKAAGDHEIAGPDQVHRKIGPGTYRAVFGRGVSYRPDPDGDPEHYVPTRKTITDDGNGWIMLESGARARVPRRANGMFSVHVRRGAPFQMHWPSAAPVVGTRDGEKVLYSDVWQDVDLEAEIGIKGIKVNYIIKGPLAPSTFDIQFPGPPTRDLPIKDQRFPRRIMEHDFDSWRVRVHEPFAWVDGKAVFMESEDLPGGRVRHTLPPLTSYPVVFDPELVVEPDADTETSSVDGHAFRSSTVQSWNTVHDNAGTGSDDTGTYIQSGFSTDGSSPYYDAGYRAIAIWDTSTIGSGSNVLGAGLTTVADGRSADWGTEQFAWVALTSSSTTSIASSDYNVANHGTTFFTPAPYMVTTAGQITNFYVYQGQLGTISKTGLTRVSYREAANDIPDEAPAWPGSELNNYNRVRSADSASDGPMLWVAYSTSVQVLDYGLDDLASGDTIVTNSVSPTANHRIFVVVNTDQNQVTPSNPTCSGCGITWTLEDFYVGAGSQHQFMVFSGSDASPTTGAITVSTDAAGNNGAWTYAVIDAGPYQILQSASVDGTRNEFDGTAPHDIDHAFSAAPTGTYSLGFIMGTRETGRGTAIVDIGTGYRAMHLTNNMENTALFNMPGTSYLVSEWITMIMDDGGSTTLGLQYGEATSLNDYAVMLFDIGNPTTLKIVNETMNMTESSVDIPSTLKILSETVNLSESNPKAFSFFRVISETLNLSESNVTWRHVLKVISETLNMAQSVYSALLPFTVKIFRATGMGIRGFKEGYNLLVRSFRGKRQQTRGFK